MSNQDETDNYVFLADNKQFVENILNMEAKLSSIPTLELTVARIKERGLGLGDLVYEMQRLASKYSKLFDIWLIDLQDTIPKQDFEDVKRYHTLRELINGQYPIGSS